MIILLINYFEPYKMINVYDYNKFKNILNVNDRNKSICE